MIFSTLSVIAQSFDDFAVTSVPPAALLNDALQLFPHGSKLGELPFDLAQVTTGNAVGFPTVPLWVILRSRGSSTLCGWATAADQCVRFIGVWFKAMIGAVLVLTLCLTLGLQPNRLGLITWLDSTPMRWAGSALLVLTFPLVAPAQSTMGRAWRIGIDSMRPTELVACGLFAMSRNPIFLALRLNLAGLFMSLPSAATLSIWLVGEVLMGVQVRLEESHLSNVLAEDYRAYAERTPRWL